MSPALRKWLRLVFLVLLVATPLVIVLSWLSESFVRDAIAVPLLYAAWIVRLYLRTVPRTLFWGALLIFGVALAATNVLAALGSRVGRDRPARGLAGIDSGYSGKVTRLTSQIRFAARSAYFKRQLARRLGRLILRSLEHEGPYSPEEVERGLDALDAPPEIRAFLREADEQAHCSQPAGFIAWLRERLRRRGGVGIREPDLDEIVEFLEDRLEAL